jgi:hypothetical protein
MTFIEKHHSLKCPKNIIIKNFLLPMFGTSNNFKAKMKVGCKSVQMAQMNERQLTPCPMSKHRTLNLIKTNKRIKLVSKSFTYNTKY